jgi:1-deoxy-D-xylulose-5-phosphate reductoisomerase
MRLPILYALAYPERIPVEGKVPLTFDLAALSRLDFQQPDLDRFPCLRLAYEAAESGGEHCIALNAADEVAVEAYLQGRIPFTGIARTIEQVLMQTSPRPPASIQQVLAADQAARRLAGQIIAQHSVRPAAVLQSPSEV